MVFALAVLASVPAIAFSQSPVILLPPIDGPSKPSIDGFWTNPGEWSKASETVVNYSDGTILVIRAMGDADFIYVLLEMPQDYRVDGHAAICFDTLRDGGPYLASDDYCFVLGETLREYHGDGKTTLMQQAAISQNILAARSVTGDNSPYESPQDHVTYEFKVPIDHLGADGAPYGFYVTFDTRGQTNNYTYYYSWPDSKNAAYLRVIPPRSWGVISSSSDVEVPEFPLPVVGAIAGVIGVMAVATRTKLFRSWR
ncbi:MAG TPA: hypothetical protein VLA68_05195 [Nitrososphaera sp.]|nr:hypothetical protein [Nitrososphaera sp.]